MNSYLLNRQLGSLSQQAFARAHHHHLLQGLQAAPHVQFDSKSVAGDGSNRTSSYVPLAHPAGVNSIAVDRFEGR